MLADVGASQRSATVCVAAVDFLERAFQLDSRGSLYDTPMPPARLAGMIGGLISGINNTKDRFGSACRAGPENEAEVRKLHAPRARPRLSRIFRCDCRPHLT